MNLPAERCKVLLVDDMPDTLGVLTRQLEVIFNVQTAVTLNDAISALKAEPYDAIVTDLHLPDGSGIELLEWVRKQGLTTGRILLTGMARLEDAVEAINRSHIHRLMLKPWRLQDLVEAIRAVTQNLHLERSHEELVDQYRVLNQQLEQRVLERTQELRNALHQIELKNQFLEKMALTDSLTGLPNRRAVELIARKELLRRTRSPNPISIGIVDIDHFKDINTNYTLDGGDHMLRWVGESLVNSIRAVDSLGRTGGEEFLVVAPDTDAQGAHVLAERLRRTIAESSTHYQGRRIAVTVSIGFASTEFDKPITFEELYKHAAKSLKFAKDNGRNCTVVKTVVPDLLTV